MTMAMASVILPNTYAQNIGLTRVFTPVKDLKCIILDGDHIHVKLGRHTGVMGIVSIVDCKNISFIAEVMHATVHTSEFAKY
jgi:hypothetical protein